MIAQPGEAAEAAAQEFGVATLLFRWGEAFVCGAGPQGQRAARQRWA